MKNSLVSKIGNVIRQALNEGVNFNAYAKERCDNRKDSEIVEEIYTNILKHIKSDKSSKTTMVQFDYSQRGYGVRPFGSGHEQRERSGECATNQLLSVLKKDYELRDEYTLQNIVRKLIERFKSNEDIIVETKEVGSYPYYYDLIMRVISINNPSKEFVTIQKYLLKYANFNLKKNACYVADTSGKRGYYSEDSTSRKYICFNEKRCARFLEELKKLKSSRDILKVEYYELNDEEDKEHSMYYETECYGSVEKTIKVTVMTPTKKVKGVVTL